MRGTPEIYKGTIVALKGNDEVEVSLSDAPKCDGCAISAACGSRPSNRIVAAIITDNRAVAIGDEVEVRCPPNTSGSAMLLGIVYPCIILVAMSLILPLGGLGTSATAAISLASVAVYYIILMLIRRRIDNRLRWQVV